MTNDRLLVVSPHFDDAVLGCGQWLAQCSDAQVVTVFAGIPDGYEGVTEWDAACGFSSSAEALRTRHAEDDAALGLLNCRSLRLPFHDAQYGAPCTVDAIADALASVLAALAPATLAFPLGLLHSDHVLTRDATLCALRNGACLPRRTFVYEEALYRRLPQAVTAALDALRASGAVVGDPLERHDRSALKRKRSALACYASQLRGLTTPGRLGHDDALAPERCWPITLAASAGAPGPR